MKWEWKCEDESWADARPLEREVWWTGASLTAMRWLLDNGEFQRGDIVTLDLRVTRPGGDMEARRVKMTVGWSMQWLGDVPAVDAEVSE